MDFEVVDGDFTGIGIYGPAVSGEVIEPAGIIEHVVYVDGADRIVGDDSDMVDTIGRVREEIAVATVEETLATCFLQIQLASCIPVFRIDYQ